MEDYCLKFEQLRYSTENEVVEFKEAKESFSIDDLGKYFSALSNEANLHQQEYAWIVFGISDRKREIVGTHFKEGDKALQQLKNDMAQHITENLSFRDIITLHIEGKRILLFKIPAAPRNIIICWKNIAWGRNGESLKPLDQAKRDEIRNQSPLPDWSAQIITTATLDDLDDMALAKAKVMYKKVHSSKIPIDEIDGWSIEDFLCNSGIMINGKLTRAAILLLGKKEVTAKLRPAVAEITWTLRDEDEIVIDYEHFSIPFIITVDQVLAKIRNLTMRELPNGTLFPDTMKQYDDYTIREALHNCIAHQDYSLQQRITFVENPGYLYYSNGGTFIPGTIEKVLDTKGPQRYYRNRCLCEAMVHFNMIDTVGRGIKKMYSEQRKRHFPMPDYQIDNNIKEVTVAIYGKMIDEKYAALLQENTSLSLKECIWLDAIQKNKPITADAIKILKAKKLIEGRAPYYRISLTVAKITHQIPKYAKIKGLDKERSIQLTIQLMKDVKDEGVTRDDVYEMLKELLPSSKTEDQKKKFVSNLFAYMKKAGLIISKGNKWFPSTKE